MFVSRDYTITQQMILFFIDKFGERLSKTLLMKLLWQSDRFHFLETGTPMSGLMYRALDRGPANSEVLNGLENKNLEESQLSSLVSQNFEIEYIDNKNEKFNINHIVKNNSELMFDEEELSQRQIRILNSVYKEYKDLNATKASEKSHEEGKEWDIVYNKQNRRYEEIPYELILSCEHLEADEKERLLKKYEEYKYDRQYVG